MSREERRRAQVAARRARRRSRRSPGPRTRRRRRILLGVGGAAAVVAAAAVVVALRTAGEDGTASSRPRGSIGRSGSVALPGAEPVTISRTPGRFRIVYRVQDPATPETDRTDVVSVERPWNSRLEVRSGRPPGGEVLSAQVATFARRAIRTSGQDPLVLQLDPGVPASDLRLDAVLPEALERGTITRREVRQVAGRRCQVYRSGDYLSAAVLSPPTEAAHVDSCVDEAGLLLEEVLTDGDRAIARRVAVTVDEDPNFEAATFVADGAARPVTEGGGSVREVAEGTSAPGDFYVPTAIPEGFEHRGRYSVVPPQAENFGEDPTRIGSRRAHLTDVWVRGNDILLLDQGGTLEGRAPWEPDPDAPTTDLGRFGQGEVLLSALGTTVRTVLDGGHYLQARGTLASAELAELIRSLRTEAGTELQLREESTATGG